MANTTGNINKMPRWFPVLLVVLALLAIKTRKDNAAENIDGSGSGNSNISSSQNAEFQQNKNKVLSAVPAELRNNYFLDAKEAGCCKTMRGNIPVTVVMISDSVGLWDAESTTNLKTVLEAGAQDIVTEATAHQVELSFSFYYHSALMAGDVCSGEDTDGWEDKALQQAGLVPLANLHNYLTEKYSSEEAPVMFVFNKPGRAFARSSGNEYMVLYAREDFDSFQHEISHIFGAKDFYYPKEVKTLAKAAFPDSVMESGETADPLTAYLIGWTDTVADSALQFLRDTNEISAEYMRKENENELFTGSGTKEFETGTYTGDLVRGECHGTGTMHYNNGSWYSGEWNHGSWSGSGTGKWIYDDGGTYEGSFLNNNRHGQGTYCYPDGTVYNGDWVEGKKQGTGTMNYSNGSVYTGGWDADERVGTGQGKEIYDNGTYEGDFLDGKRHGQGTYIWSCGDKYIGQWANGELHGYGTYTFANGKTRTGNWNNGNFVG